MNCFPKSFLLLQQEAILTKSCLLNGFECLIDGNFDDVYKGKLYSAFFNISIGLERIMKLAIITDYMLKNDYNTPPQKDIRDYGHDISGLYKKCIEIVDEYKIEYNENDVINKSILAFFNDFAAAQKGRYANISDLDQNPNQSHCPLDQWKEITHQIYSKDLKQKTKDKIEERIDNNKLLLQNYFTELAKGVDIIDDARLFYMTTKTNRYAIWRTIKIIEPIMKLLEFLSWESHKKDTEIEIKDYPSYPYYNEIFYLHNLSKPYILKFKKWNNLQ